jgi:hypothetical protein
MASTIYWKSVIKTLNIFDGYIAEFKNISSRIKLGKFCKPVKQENLLEFSLEIDFKLIYTNQYIYKYKKEFLNNKVIGLIFKESPTAEQISIIKSLFKNLVFAICIGCDCSFVKEFDNVLYLILNNCTMKTPIKNKNYLYVEIHDSPKIVNKISSANTIGYLSLAGMMTDMKKFKIGSKTHTIAFEIENNGQRGCHQYTRGYGYYSLNEFIKCDLNKDGFISDMIIWWCPMSFYRSLECPKQKGNSGTIKSKVDIHYDILKHCITKYLY